MSRALPIWNKMGFQNRSGKISLLHINDTDYGYGTDPDSMDVDVIIALDTQPNMAFGFKMRDNDNEIVSQGMLQLLIAAYRNNWTVNVSYWEFWYKGDSGNKKRNNVIHRIWVQK